MVHDQRPARRGRGCGGHGQREADVVRAHHLGNSVSRLQDVAAVFGVLERELAALIDGHAHAPVDLGERPRGDRVARPLRRAVVARRDHAGAAGHQILQHGSRLRRHVCCQTPQVPHRVGHREHRRVGDGIGRDPLVRKVAAHRLVGLPGVGQRLVPDRHHVGQHRHQIRVAHRRRARRRTKRRRHVGGVGVAALQRRRVHRPHQQAIRASVLARCGDRAPFTPLIGPVARPLGQIDQMNHLTVRRREIERLREPERDGHVGPKALEVRHPGVHVQRHDVDPKRPRPGPRKVGDVQATGADARVVGERQPEEVAWRLTGPRHLEVRPERAVVAAGGARERLLRLRPGLAALAGDAPKAGEAIVVRHARAADVDAAVRAARPREAVEQATTPGLAVSVGDAGVTVGLGPRGRASRQRRAVQALGAVARRRTRGASRREARLHAPAAGRPEHAHPAVRALAGRGTAGRRPRAAGGATVAGAARRGDGQQQRTDQRRPPPGTGTTGRRNLARRRVPSVASRPEGSPAGHVHDDIRCPPCASSRRRRAQLVPCSLDGAPASGAYIRLPDGSGSAPGGAG